MLALLAFLLFWIGALITYVGTAVAPAFARTRLTAAIYMIVCIFGGGAVLMGTATVNLSYVPPSIMNSVFSGIAAWSAIAAGVFVVFTKPMPDFERQTI